MIAKEKIIHIVEEHLQDSDLFLVGVKVSARNKIMVSLDGDNGVPIIACVKVSRQIESQLDREKEDFELEVSSVGIDTPLILPRQFIKNKGRDIIYTDTDGKKIKAKLLEADQAGVTVEKEMPKKKKKDTIPLEDPVVKLSYAELTDVKVQVSFKEPKKKE